MLWDPAEILNILPYKLWRSMVVIENRKDAVEKGMVYLPYAYIDGEQRVYDCKHEEMQLLSQESPYRLQYAISRDWRLRFARRSHRKVGIEHLLPLPC